MTSDARRFTRLVPPFATRLPFLVTAGAIAALVIFYVLAGFFLVPRLITTYVPRYVTEQLKRRAEIGEVRFNPLLFKLEIKQFRLQEADGRPLLGFDRLFVDFEPTGVFRRAWTFAEIQLDAPRVDVVLLPSGRLNLLDLLDTLPRSEAKARPEAAPSRMLLEHAVVRGGWLTFTDQTRHAAQTAAVQPIDIELRNITTLPERRGPYAIAATLKDGGVVGWDGEVSLLPLGSTGKLGLRGFPLATVWRFVQDDVTLAEPSGRIDAAVRYQLAYKDGAMSFRVDDLGVTVEGLGLTQRGAKEPLLALDRIRLAGGRGDLMARELTIPEISVSHGRLGATVASDGTLNWQTLRVAPEPPTTPPPAPAPPAASTAATASARPWRVGVEKIKVEDVALSLEDQSRAVPIRVDVAGLALDLSARIQSGPAGLVGTADGIGLRLARVEVRAAGTTDAAPVSVDGVAVEGGRVDLESRKVTVSRVAVTGGATRIERPADGSLPLLTMLGLAARPSPARADVKAAVPARPAPPASAKPWSVAVEKLDLVDYRLAIVDRSVSPVVELQVDGIKVSARELHTDGPKLIPFDASFRVAQGGRFTASGRVAPDGRSAEAKLTLTQLALKSAQPYVARSAAVELRSGDVSTTGLVTYRRRDSGRAAVTYTGVADVDRLLVIEPVSGERVVSWKSLHAGTMRLSLAPDRLEIDEVRLTELDGKLIIFKDKSTSLGRLMKRGGEPATAPASGAAAPPPAAVPPTPAPAATAGAPAADALFPVLIERLRLDQGAVDFADLSLVLPFAARVHALNGVVTGLGSDASSRASVKLDGRVDEFGLLKVDGSLSPFNPKAFTDLTVIFRNVPMALLTPYGVTFVGRRIVGGTMNLDLEYKIDRSVLAGENKVVLQRLQLGERVESPGAMSLPLDLAIAILSDSQGRIDIAMPVRGNVDHPEFAYGELVWQALVTVIKKIATAPFRALAGLFGGGGSESVDAIVFDAGSDTVLPPEREKLKRVGEVLDKRPRLKLVVHGGYEAKADGEALRSLRVRRDLAQRLGAKVDPGEDPGPVAFDSVKTQRALEALYTERGRAIDEVQGEYEKTTGKKAERANPVLALVNRGAGDRAFYEALFRRLVDTTPLADAELTALGRRRGEGVARVLKEGAGTLAERVTVADPEAAKSGTRNTIPTRLELDALTGS